MESQARQKRQRVKKGRIRSIKVLFLVSGSIATILLGVCIGLLGFFTIRSGEQTSLFSAYKHRLQLYADATYNRFTDTKQVMDKQVSDLNLFSMNLLAQINAKSERESFMNLQRDARDRYKVFEGDFDISFIAILQGNSSMVQKGNAKISNSDIEIIADDPHLVNDTLKSGAFSTYDANGRFMHVSFIKGQRWNYILQFKYKTAIDPNILSSAAEFDESNNKNGSSYIFIMASKQGPVSTKDFRSILPNSKRQSYILDPSREGQVASNSIYSTLLKSFNTPTSEKQVSYGKETIDIKTRNVGMVKIDYDGTNRYMFVLSMPEMGWVFVFTVSQKTFDATFLKTASIFALESVLIALIIFTIPLFIYTIRMGNNMAKISYAIQNIAEGDGDLSKNLSIPVKYELGMIQAYLNRFISSLAQLLRAVQERVESSEMQLNVDKPKFLALANQMHRALTSFSELEEHVLSLTSNIEQVQVLIRTLSQNSGYLGEKFKNQENVSKDIDGALVNISNVLEEQGNLNSRSQNVLINLQTIADNSFASNDVLIKQVQDIEESSQTISEVVGILTNIAEQTNLLAMNAAIEAAHAGDYGKGFAVVAEEIRKLAENATLNANQISKLLSDITQKISETALQGESTLKNLDNMRITVSQTLEIGNRLIASTQSQRETTGSIQSFMRDFVQISDQMSTTIQEQEDSSNRVLSNIRDLHNQSSELLALSTDRKEQMEKTDTTTQTLVRDVEMFLSSIGEIKSTLSHFKTKSREIENK